jgi:hypothetical protein
LKLKAFVDSTTRRSPNWRRGLRWTYTLGTLVTLIGVTLMSPSVLWSLAAITSAGIFLTVVSRRNAPSERRA